MIVMLAQGKLPGYHQKVHEPHRRLYTANIFCQGTIP